MRRVTGPLTSREAQVALMAEAGMPTSRIAQKLKRTESTVRTTLLMARQKVAAGAELCEPECRGPECFRLLAPGSHSTKFCSDRCKSRLERHKRGLHLGPIDGGGGWLPEAAKAYLRAFDFYLRARSRAMELAARELMDLLLPLFVPAHILAARLHRGISC